MRFSLNLPCLYRGETYDDALAKVRAAGFDTVECWALPAGEEIPLGKALRARGVQLSAMCPREFVLNDPARHDLYEVSLKDALAQAKALGCSALITQVGNNTGAPREQQHAAIVQGLRRMLPLLRAAGATLLVEPLNDMKDHPGYYLTSSMEGLEIIREVNDPHVRLLFDIYHQVHMGEDVGRIIRENLPLIGHFHIAGHPARDERIFENFDYAPLLDELQAMGNTAPLGLELRPSSPTAREELFERLRPWRD